MLYDLERGGAVVDPQDFFKNYVEPYAKRLDKRTFKKMCDTFDLEVGSLKPSENSQLVWTKCGAMIGHRGSAPVERVNHMWDKASEATGSHPDNTNKFVGAVLMWRISLRKEKWLSTKTLDKGGVHPYRSYWINQKYTPTKSGFTVQDLAAKFNRGRR